MKIPLLYQRTRCDCGPTALLNAVSYLFDLEEIPPDILRFVMMYTLDRYNAQGEPGYGTTQMAMMFLSGWLNQYSKAKKLRLSCEYISGEQVRVTENSKIADTIRQGGAAVVRVFDESWHYVTMTGVNEGSIEMFDPYYDEEPFAEPGIEIVAGSPFTMNRRVKFGVFNREGFLSYTLGPVGTREAVLMRNDGTYVTQENTIEYYL